jgi:hypothetical protein
VEVLKDLPRTDVAILTALTNLEARRVDVERLERALSLLKVPMQDYSLIEGVLATLDEGSEGSSGNLEKTDAEEFRKSIADLQGWRTLEYVVALLRHYRPEFDDLPREEKHGLIVGCCRRVNALLEASRQLGAFLEYGARDRDLRAPLEEVERYVRAAELKDVEGLRASANRLRSAARPSLPAVADPSFSNESPYDDDHLREGQPEVDDFVPTLGTPHQLLVGILPGVGTLYDPSAGRLEGRWPSLLGDLCDEPALQQSLAG